MSKISSLIFKGEKHYVTSPFGARSVISTSAGKTSSYHSGCDYGTDGKKIAQYAIEDGYVMDAAKASDGALYVWVIYPGCKLAMLHYHLDSYKVEAGQKVQKGTLLGYTGMTGKATGVHLHLGIKPLKSVSSAKSNAVTYAVLGDIAYVDPEKVSYKATTAAAATAAVDKKTGFKVGDAVKIKNGAKSYGGKTLSSFVYGKEYRIDELSGKRAVLNKTGICTAVNTDNLIKIYKTGLYKVTASVLNVRAGAGTSYKVKTFKELTANAQTQIKSLNNKKQANGLVAGCTCTVTQVSGNWGKIPSGWICLDYCVKL